MTRLPFPAPSLRRAPARATTGFPRILRAPPLVAPALLLAASACDPWPPPPSTARHTVVDTLHGVEFADDYRWLEDQDNPETRAWIAEQNAYAERVVGDTPLRSELAGRLRELMDVQGPIFPRRAGDFEYFSLRRPGREVAAIHRRPAPGEPERDPIDPDGDFEVVVDPLDIHPDGTTSVSIRDFSPDGTLMMYAVRDGGRDEVEIRIRDLAAGEDMPDRLPTFLYGSTFFDPEGAGFYYTWRSREIGPRVRHHTLGDEIADDRELFGEGHGPEKFINATLGPTTPGTAASGGDGRYLVYSVQHGWARTDLYIQDLQRGGEPEPLIVGAPARFSPRFVRGELWLLTNVDAPNNRLFAVDLNRRDPANWREVIGEGDDPLTGYQLIGDEIYADYLHNVGSRIVRYDLEGNRTGEIPLPERHVANLRSWGEGAGLLALTSLVTPSHILRIDLETMETEPWLPSAVPFDGSGYETTQVWYTSADGTRAPMHLAHRRGLVPDGNAPALLHGYGGFNVNNLPRFNANAAAWMERGGIYALATLRGGGEFGEDWHRAGMLENKPNVFDDFIAAAEWLVASGYTNPGRLAIRGVSNGGLLVGAALTKRPELFRAVFCGLPDLDMVRFHQFTHANNMPALLEYGNAAVREEFEVLRRFSPYQNVRDGVAYPAVMLTQGDLDTRVPPLQARKMAARLQAATASGLPVILDYDPRAGHAGGRTFSRSVRNNAMELAFLFGQLGVEE